MYLALLITALAASNCTHTATTFRCVKYIGNYDGDTITVSIPNVHPLLGEKISVRIAGVDTAEIKGKSKCEKQAALKAKELVSKVLSTSLHIELSNVRRDKYFRILADVHTDKGSIATLLQNKGLAYVYEGGTKENTNWCVK